MENGGIIDTAGFAHRHRHESLSHGGINAIDGGLTKNGLGTLMLAAPNTYNGGTTVNLGTLQLGDPQALGSGPLTVNSNGTVDFSTASVRPSPGCRGRREHRSSTSNPSQANHADHRRLGQPQFDVLGHDLGQRHQHDDHSGPGRQRGVRPREDRLPAGARPRCRRVPWRWMRVDHLSDQHQRRQSQHPGLWAN